MKRKLDRGAERGVEKAELLFVEIVEAVGRDAERADGVPYADALDGRVVLDRKIRPELLGLGIGGFHAAFVERLRLGILPHVFAAKDPAAADHSGNAAGGVGAAAE